ncbi:MAG: inositol monophosphatase family protein [Balneolaceae bacterium]
MSRIDVSTYQEELACARSAARNAAETIRTRREKEFGVRYKALNDLVTDVDVAVEKQIQAELHKAFPEDAWMGEESDDGARLPEGRVWIVDPIDGTTNFTYGFPVYCVSIALWEGKKPKVGVVVEVTRNEEFVAVAGEGAWLDSRPVTVSELQEPGTALVGTGFAYNDHEMLDAYIALFHYLTLETQGMRRPGSAAFDLCCVACGRFQGFYEYALKPWDVAAAGLIVQEAGGVVTDWTGGDQWLDGERIVAGNHGLHAWLLIQIERFIPASYLPPKL